VLVILLWRVGVSGVNVVICTVAAHSPDGATFSVAITNSLLPPVAVPGRTPVHSTNEPETLTEHLKSSDPTNDQSHDVMTVEIPPGEPSTAGKTSAEDPTEIPPLAARKQFAAARADSMEVPSGVTAAMAVTGKQSTSETDGAESDSTATRL